jgi:peroxiredoxin
VSGATVLLDAGSPAPPFRAEASDGNTYELAELLRAGHVVLIFYPGNDTPG